MYVGKLALPLFSFFFTRFSSHRVDLGLISMQMCNLREKAHLKKNYTPEGSAEHMFPGTYYLTGIDDMFRRSYEIKS